nr:zinc finger BED domain-containing protein 5-like [Penaeus vannamei]
MSSDIEKTVSEQMNDKMYALQADESIDIGGHNIFSTVADYLKEMGLTWKLCVGICADGCPSMVGSVKGFVSPAKENPQLITTHCFLHRENLIAKTLGHGLKRVLESLLLHTEVRWLSRSKVLSRVHELRQEILVFFALEGTPEFCDLLADDIWSAKLCYLADIFEHLNKVNSSMRNENILTSYDKMKALLEKIRLWKDRPLSPVGRSVKSSDDYHHFQYISGINHFKN